MSQDSSLKFLFLVFLAASFEMAIAQEVEVHNMSEMLGSINLERKQVEKIVERLEKSGRISAEEGAKVRREIASVQDNDLEQIKQAAIAELVRSGR